MNEAAVERIASLPGFLVGSTFHGIVPQVKHQMMSRVRGPQVLLRLALTAGPGSLLGR
jgi:hypothetical protein